MKPKPRLDTNEVATKWAETTIVLIIGFLFSTAIVGSSSYLLFNAAVEELELDAALSNVEADVKTEELFNTLLQTVAHGWFANKANLTAEAVIMRDISSTRTLEPASYADARKWSGSAVQSLSSEYGFITGFVFQDELKRQIQKRLSELYAQKLEALRELRELLLADSNGRDLRKPHYLHARSPGELALLYQRAAEIGARNKVLLRRKIAAALGVLFGGGILTLILVIKLKAPVRRRRVKSP